MHVLGDRAPRPSDAVIDLVLTQTGGHPALVDRMLAALIELGGADPTRWRWDPSRPPSSLLAQLGYAVHRLPDGVRDLLRARALGAPLEPDLLVPVLGRVAADPAALDELVEAARAEGLLTAEGAPIPLVSAAVLERTPPATRLEMRRALAERELERGGNVLAAARRLLGTGVSGARVAGVFTAAGDESLRTGLPGARRAVRGGRRRGRARRRAGVPARRGRAPRGRSRPRPHPGRPGALGRRPGAYGRSRAGRDGRRRRPRPPRHARPQRGRVPLPRRADGSGGGARAHRHGRVGRGAGGARRAAARTSRRRCSRGPRS